MDISFSENFNLKQYRDDFQQDRRTRIESVFDNTLAHRLSNHLTKDISYINAYTQNGQPATATTDEIKRWPAEKQKHFIQTLYADASQGVGFYYGRHKIERKDNEQNLSAKVFQWLNSPDTIEKIKQITAAEDIICASAQATRYTPGNYLTRHNDVHPAEQRRIAYVLNFTEAWHPDWGGNLQFYQQNGTPRDAWSPLFNSMTLFDVNHVHSVTYVAPFALRPRVAITGWFRATPL